jgi:signal transduction histidine kinase
VLFVAPAVVASGAGAALVIQMLTAPDMLRAWWAAGLPWDLRPSHAPCLPMLSGVLYAAVMWSTIDLARWALLRRVPLRTGRDLALHVTIVGAATALSFALAYTLDQLALGPLVARWAGLPPERPSSKPPVSTIAVVACATAFLCVLAMYAFSFYRRLRDTEDARMQAELGALRAQINPHFLFNTLNSIAALVRLRPEEAEGVTERLADLFRYTLRASRVPAVTLAEDWAAARLYLDIEATRFAERLVVTHAIAPEVAGAQVPSLLFQPLVENAVKHGVARTEGACAVDVRAWRDGGSGRPLVRVTVRDTGPGFDSADAEAVLARGTGLANVRDRLRHLFGPDATLRLLPDGVALTFPYRRAAPPSVEARAGRQRLTEEGG